MEYTRKKRVKTWLVMLCMSLLIMSIPLQAAASGSSDINQEQSATGLSLTQQSASSFLDEFFNSSTSYYAGAAISIVKDGKIIASKGYGYANVEKQSAIVPEETVFRIASVSKTFTAVAIMQLVEQGKLDLHEDISKYLPNITINNPFSQAVTIDHLLTHESGFEVRDPNAEDLHTDYQKYVSIEDYVQQNLPPVLRKPGTSYMYDNFAYLLLGLIVQNVSGVPYEEYLEKHIFEPIGMENSGFLLEGKLLDHLVTGYDTANQVVEPYVFMPTIMPHGGMLTTAKDIEKFMIAFLNEGKADNGVFLTENSVKEMLKYQSAIHPLLPNTSYGFEAPSQVALAGSSDKVVTKLGDLPGNSSMLMFIPEEETGVFLSYNNNGPLRELFYAQFMSTFYPKYVSPAQLPAFEAYSVEQLSKFEGYYSDLRLKTLVSSIKVTDTGTLLISDSIIGPRTLQQVDNNLFIDQLTQKYTGFQIDSENGNIYMKEPYLNPVGTAIKGVNPEGFSDIDGNNEYAAYILALQSIGHYSNDKNLAFEPNKPVTRAEYIYNLLDISAIKGSPTTELAFNDISTHPLSSYIQAAYELGMIQGDGKGNFHPDRVITRQEAAMMVWNIYRMLYPADIFETVQLTGQTDQWAITAVKLMTVLGYHGPEVTFNEDGAADYRSKESLTRQEEAAILYQMLFQPINSIIASMTSNANEQ